MTDFHNIRIYFVSKLSDIDSEEKFKKAYQSAFDWATDDSCYDDCGQDLCNPFYDLFDREIYDYFLDENLVPYETAVKTFSNYFIPFDVIGQDGCFSFSKIYFREIFKERANQLEDFLNEFSGYAILSNENIYEKINSLLVPENTDNVYFSIFDENDPKCRRDGYSCLLSKEDFLRRIKDGEIYKLIAAFEE